MRTFSLQTELALKYMLIKSLFFFTLPFIHLMCFCESTRASEIKKEIIKFSSETAHFKKKDGVLYLSGDVKISYRGYLIKSDFLVAKTNDVSSQEIKIIEAQENIFFSNNKDIVARGNKLYMDIEKKFVSIEGDVEFSQDKSIIRANKINVDLETETVDFEGIKDSFIKE